MWWGEVEIPPGQAVCWRLGPLTLWAVNRGDEWRLAHEVVRDDPPAERAEVEGPIEPPAEPPPGATLERVALRRIDGRLRLLPLLADRSIVNRPEVPFRVPAGEETAFFVSTPVWVRLEMIEPPEALIEVATTRLSDTWFGPSTLEGELCYASRTKARLHLENVTIMPWRAVTKVQLRNRARTPLLLERFNLPAASCALYAGAGDSLWTPTMTVERDDEGHLAGVRLADAPPEEAGEARLVSPPRTPAHRNYLVRALSALLG